METPVWLEIKSVAYAMRLRPTAAVRCDLLHYHDLVFRSYNRGRRNNGSTKIKGEHRTADQLLEHGASDAGADPVIVGHFVHEPKQSEERRRVGQGQQHFLEPTASVAQSQ